MTREEVWQCIMEVGIIPAVRASSAELAVAAAKAVWEGGIPIVEVAMTIPGAIGVIEDLAREIPGEVLVGAGSVLGAETAARCLDAGADFIASPGFDSETVKLANLQDKLVVAGALTPTEIIAAWKAGSDFVKVFPCDDVGGPKYVRALKAALPQIPLVPAGEIGLDIAASFLCAGASAGGVADELIAPEALRERDMGAITEAARRYVSIVRAARERQGERAA